MDVMTAPQPHDLLRLHPAAGGLLPLDAPAWVRDVLQTTAWVVVRRDEALDGLIPVGVRGINRSQRYPWWVAPEWVRHNVTPEALRIVEPRARRHLPAMRTLAAVRAALRDMAIDWGPTGSVGFELATGVPTATPESDLDLVVRAPADPAQLAVVHHRLLGLDARVDCQVETRSGAIALAELVSGCDEILARTTTGPRLIPHAAAMP
jgi:phosphoribosyl-dephospho-CoA transferase